MRTLEDIHLQDLRRKNGLVFRAVAAIGIMTLVTIISFGIAQGFDSMTLGVIGLQLLTIAVLGTLHFTKKMTVQLPYIAISLTFISIFVSLLQSPGAVSLLAPYYLMAIAVMYTRMRPFLLGAALAVVYQVCMVYGLNALEGMPDDMPVTSFIYLLLVGIVLFYLVRSSQFVFKDVETSAREASELSVKLGTQQDNLIAQVASISENMNHLTQAGDDNVRSFEQMNSAFREIASGAGEQADSTAKIAESAEQSNRLIESMASSLVDLTERSTDALGRSEAGQATVHELVTVIHEFQDSLRQMSDDIRQLNTAIRETAGFSSAIQEVAAQTNLLALNASIEAARAGESGRGFAVVANEIRKLADLSGRSAEQISSNLAQVEREAAETGEMMNKVGSMMERSTALTADTRSAFQDIAAAVTSLTNRIDEYGQVVGTIRDASREIEQESQAVASVTEQATATLQELSATVETLLETNGVMIGRLKETDQAVKKLLD